MNVNAATIPDKWVALARFATNVAVEVKFNGCSYGEIHRCAKEGYWVAIPRHCDPKVFRGGDEMADQAWRYVVGEPVPLAVIHDLQDQALEVAPWA